MNAKKQVKPVLQVRRARAGERGLFLLEALIAILIFSFGILGLVGMQGKAISAQSDAQYRIDAANAANKILSEIWINIDRTNSVTLQASLLAFQHQPSGTNCSFGGAASANAYVIAWVDGIRNGSSALPGASAAMQQIIVDTAAGSYNRVTVTVCWQAPVDSSPRRHTVITYVNYS